MTLLLLLLLPKPIYLADSRRRCVSRFENITFIFDHRVIHIAK